MAQSPLSSCPTETFSIIKWILLIFSWGIYCSCTVFDQTKTEGVWISLGLRVRVCFVCLRVVLHLYTPCRVPVLHPKTLPVVFHIYIFRTSFSFGRALMPKQTYTGCPRRNVPDFGRVSLMLKYTDITQNTYVQSWTVTEIMAREVWNFDSCYTLIDYQIHIKTGRNMWFL